MVGVAQLVEHRVVVPVAAGSSPVAHPNRFLMKPNDGLTALMAAAGNGQVTSRSCCRKAGAKE